MKKNTSSKVTRSYLSSVCTLRLNYLEAKVMEGVGKTPDIICDLHNQVESFKRKLEVCWALLKSLKTRHFDPDDSNRLCVLCGRAWHT